MKKGKDLYVRLSDKGVTGQDLYWEDCLEPDASLISELRMEKSPLGWKTTLTSLSKVSAELISVVPHQHETIGNGRTTRIHNDYLFRIPEILEDYEDVEFV